MVSCPPAASHRLGMEGLEAAEGSSTGSSDDSEDDDHEDAPGTSGPSCCARENGSDGGEVAADSPGSVQSSGSGTRSESPKELQNPMTEPGQGILEKSGTEPGETSTRDHNERKTVTVTETEETPARKETESPEPTEKGQETGVIGEDRAAMALSGEDRKSIPAATPEGSNSGDTALGVEALDLSAFSSAAELELLGLERLKCELMALGLKCGGTLQERAARLFSVRGLSKELIDPTLFAKPSKGKKK